MPWTRNTPRATRSPPATSRPAPFWPEPPSRRAWTSPNGSTSVPPAVRTVRLTSIPTRNWCTSTPSASISSSPAAVVSRAHDASPRSCSSTPPPTVASRRRTSTRPSRSPRRSSPAARTAPARSPPTRGRCRPWPRSSYRRPTTADTDAPTSGGRQPAGRRTEGPVAVPAAARHGHASQPALSRPSKPTYAVRRCPS